MPDVRRQRNGSRSAIGYLDDVQQTGAVFFDVEVPGLIAVLSLRRDSILPKICRAPITSSPVMW
jgi:hypothetical protein